MVSKRVVAIAVVCAVVGASALTISTSAFSATTLERTAEVQVGTDASALLALIDGHPNADIVQQEDGALTIDFANARSAGGIPPDVLVKVGSTQTPASDHAFRIVNQGTQTRDVVVEYTLAGSARDGDKSTRNLRFEFYLDRGDDGTIESSYSISEHAGNNRLRISDVGPGDVVYCVIVFDTNGLSPQSDLGGSLEITAGDTS